MSNRKKAKFPGDLKGFKFKAYWIYIIIFIFFIGLNLIGTDVTRTTNWQEFNQNMLQQQKVEKVIVEIASKKTAEPKALLSAITAPKRS